MFGIIPALYLSPDEVRVPPVVRPVGAQAMALREQIRSLPGVRIGIIYGGNPDRRDDWLRTVPLEVLGTIARVKGVSWVNLMVDERADKQQARELFQYLDPMPEVHNFADTAAIVEELDAVVAVDCSVAHVTGNLGKPLWILAPPSADWRWQIGDDVKPWWPTARLLRSEAPGKWTEAIAVLERELSAFVESRMALGERSTQLPA